MAEKKRGLKDLREKLTTIALSSPEFKEALKSASEEIIVEAKKAANEATIEGVFERVLYAILREIGIKFHPEKEVALGVIRHTGKGRADSRIGALVIEYKHRDKLKFQGDISSAKNQLEGYACSISSSLHNEVIGFLTDGLSLYEARAFDGKIASWSGEQSINNTSLLNLIRNVVSLEQSALTAENLIRDFCGASYDEVLFDVARILNSILLKKSTLKTNMLRSEWEELFRLAHDDQSQQKRIEERRAILSDIFKEDLKDASAEYRALFALHSAYAIVLKLIAYRVVSDVQFGSPMQNYKSLIGADSQVLRSFCADLEDGEIFRKLGILNLLEGDFFSWYSDTNQWNKSLSDALQEILEILGRYEDVVKIFATVDAIDLFRELYEATVPQVVRASFGEFYTPFWLAQHVLHTSGLNKNWKALDPCCGSGTFIIAAISEIRRENKGANKNELLSQILARVCAFDLNPLAVLTTRIHYFIHIANLLPNNLKDLVIPVFLGDSSYVPEKINISGVDCLSYKLRTLKEPISIELPINLVGDTSRFVQLMYKYEKLVKNQDEKAATKLLIDALREKDKNQAVTDRMLNLTKQLVELEKKKWNGIWARIITNFLTTACLNNFSNIISNPPWIDWKNLPAGYREKVKSLCIEKGLFSGAGRTGGINLNICALIAHVAATNWLSRDGKLAFLMPKELAYQSSYEGWRKSVGGNHRGFLQFHDWSNAGHPFDPVKEDFMTYVIGLKEDGKGRLNGIVPTSIYIKRAECETKAHEWKNINEAMENLEIQDSIAGQIISGSTAFTFAKNKEQLARFKQIAGECAYIGREGIEFYPQELLIFTFDSKGPRAGTVFLKNIQVQKSKYKISSQKVLLETKYLYPLAKGKEIEHFHHNYENLIVPFPYEEGDSRRPVDAKKLEEESPLLLDYYRKYEKIIRAQTLFSDKIRGPNSGEFYGLARTGKYSFQNIHVAFRDNTKWRATVVTSGSVPWGTKKRLLFQNHAVSMCERDDDSGYINEDEAHYICAILNAPIVEEFIYASSDNRSFKIRPPIFVPKYNKADKLHKELSELSKQAHKTKKDVDNLRREIEKIYLEICKNEKK